jgi:hypothetical protein
MTDTNTKAVGDPGWSNSPPNDGISSTEPPPGERDMHTPGWSNDPVALPPATGATAGTPGSWTPAGTAPCPVFTQMDTITATPVTTWTTGQYVVLGDASEAYWDGAAWAAGRAA